MSTSLPELSMSLLYSGPSLAVLHDDYAARGRVDSDAQLTSSSRLVVDAPVDRVWTVMADLRAWPSWASGIRILELGDVRPGAPFRWRLNGVPLRSRFAVVDPRRELTWTGIFLGRYRAVDRHVLEPLEGGRTRITVEESLAGPLLPLFYRESMLRANHERWLSDLARATA
ncbi:SRPBCC domain-containing protein [Microbispora bryophytorum]|uniref:SRPBCC domain-containing protein n=1 Tax=Microbispora bryophytorum subsp. camponoti TaxID=1677852 RepID=A0ABR8KXI5_9ACTN|nr:SRPBCC domain-containing protein [Microbispora camponoti]MBD3143448.1 SRPBCC domain-containing protein [Microbispora camponoti]